jgi:PAS domain S-box-containing protein
VHVSTRALELAGTWRILGIWTDLTEQKRAQREIERERTRYQQLLRTSRDGIHILDGDGNLIEANAAFLDSLGYSRQEAIGLNVRDWDAHFTTEELALKVEALTRASGTFETKHRRRDGSEIDIEISATGIELDGTQYVYASARDITGRKRAEEARRASEARFRDLAMMSADWMWEQDDQFRFTYVSDGYYAKTGMTPEETLGKTRWEISHLGVSEADWRAHRVALERHEVFADFVHRRPTPDGEIRWLTTTGKPIFDANGTFRGYRGVGRDVTELHRHLDELAASEARWQFAIEGQGDGLWDWNTKDRRIFLSPPVPRNHWVRGRARDRSVRPMGDVRTSRRPLCRSSGISALPAWR